MLTTQQKYDKIMEEMADKTLEFGCEVFIQNHIVSVTICGDNTGKCEVEGTEYSEFIGQVGSHTQPFGLRHIKEIIGHPLYIGDVLNYIELHQTLMNGWNPNMNDLIRQWKDKRLALSPTDVELVDFIYNLLP